MAGDLASSSLEDVALTIAEHALPQLALRHGFDRFINNVPVIGPDATHIHEHVDGVLDSPPIGMLARLLLGDPTALFSPI